MFERNEYTGQWRWTWNDEAWKPQDRNDFANNDGARGGGRDGGGHDGGGRGGGRGGGHDGGGGGQVVAEVAAMVVAEVVGGYGGGGCSGAHDDRKHADYGKDCDGRDTKIPTMTVFEKADADAAMAEAMKEAEEWAKEIESEAAGGWATRTRIAEHAEPANYVAEARSRKVDLTGTQKAKSKPSPV